MPRSRRDERPPPPVYYRKKGGATFEPRFTLGVLYLFGFFFVYCLLLVAPALLQILATVPTGPEQEAAARVAAQEAVQPRLWIAAAASALSTILGAHYRVLPGMRSRP
jgi:hypothetical protein